MSTHVDVDPGPITGAKDPADWAKTLKKITVDVTARGELSKEGKKVIEERAIRSPVNFMFGKAGLRETKFHYQR